MKKETQFLRIVMLCGLTVMIASGCGIIPSKLVSPSEAEQERLDEQNGTKPKEPVVPKFPAVYPKPAR